jgi:prepilin-type N-terminal cleavage/methylation domain-containing protein
MIRKYGFTFIEIIIGMVIFTMIMFAVYNVLNIGLKAWHRNQTDVSIRDIRLAFLRMEKDLKGTFFFSRMPFKGLEKGLTFPLSLPKDDTRKLCVVTYKIEKDNASGVNSLVRIEKYFNDGDDAANIKKIAGSLESATFEYAYEARSNGKTYEWMPLWDGAGQGRIPSGVRISVRIKGREEFYNKIIFLPHGDLGVK